MSLGAMVVVFLILVLMGIIPIWPHSRSWGYAPSGGVGLVVVVFVVLLVLAKFSIAIISTHPPKKILAVSFYD